MSLTQRRETRGRALVLCLVLLMTLLLSAFHTVQAVAVTHDESAETELIITKVEQPQAFGVPANGLPLDPDVIGEATPIAGVQYEVRQVPGIDPTTSDGQSAAANMTVAEARAFVEGRPAVDSGVTGTDGVLRLGGQRGTLGLGLYLVEETQVPAGVVPADPFLVSLPLTHPDGDEWLYTVHVYPKNSRVNVFLDVVDEGAVALGDPVTWTSRSDIPRETEIDGYRVDNLLDLDLELLDTAEQIQVALTGAGTMELSPEDYVVTIVTVDGRETVRVDFTAAGREKLATIKGAYPDAQVTITYRTAVLAEGIHVNDVRLYPDARTIAGHGDVVTDEAVTKWGPISVLVHEHNNPDNLIPGARFQLYLTEENARAGRNPIVVDGISEWTTDENGRLIVHGLRFSDFVNGFDRDVTDLLYRYYWAAPTYVPDGWQWVNDTPLAGTVTDVTDYQTLIFEVTKKTDLPYTGARAAGLALLGLLLVVGGYGLRRNRA